MSPKEQAKREIAVLADELAEYTQAIGAQLSEIAIYSWMAKTKMMCEDAVLEGPHILIDPNLHGNHAIDRNGKHLVDYGGINVGGQFMHVRPEDMPCLRIALSDLQVPTDFIDADSDGVLDTVEYGDMPGDYCDLGYVPAVDGGFYAFVSCDGYSSEGHQVLTELQ